MMNKSKSKKRNLTKLGIVLPFIISFILLFNVKIEAKPIFDTQVKSSVEQNRGTIDARAYSITKETSKDELQSLRNEISKSGGKFTVENLKRNKEGQIVSIKVTYKSPVGGYVTGTYQGEDGINTIHFGENEEGGVFISTDPFQVSDLIKGENSHTEQSINGSGNSSVIVHDSTDASLIIGKTSGIRLDLDDKIPLIFLDGIEVPYSTFKDLVPENIYSINVSKGEQAIQKFGDRAKDGVIEVSLKKLTLTKDETTGLNDYSIIIVKTMTNKQLKKIKKEMFKNDLEFNYGQVERNKKGELSTIELSIKELTGIRAGSTTSSKSIMPIPSILLGRMNGEIRVTSSF